MQSTPQFEVASPLFAMNILKFNKYFAIFFQAATENSLFLLYSHFLHFDHVPCIRATQNERNRSYILLYYYLRCVPFSHDSNMTHHNVAVILVVSTVLFKFVALSLRWWSPPSPSRPLALFLFSGANINIIPA